VFKKEDYVYSNKNFPAMAKKVETRLYSMSDADLKQTADFVFNLVTRDLGDFGRRNVTADTLTDLQALINNFDDVQTDEELQGIVMDATQAKDVLAEDLRKKIRTIRNMAELEYNNKGKYNSFGFEDMANMNDNELYRLAKRVVRVSTTLLSDLGNQGLVEADITDLSTAAALFDTAIDAQHSAIENRDLATEARVTIGNELWDELTRLCSIGKSIYEDTDEARYNDYVLTASAPAGNVTPPTA